MNVNPAYKGSELEYAINKVCSIFRSWTRGFLIATTETFVDLNLKTNKIGCLLFLSSLLYHLIKLYDDDEDSQGINYIYWIKVEPCKSLDFFLNFWK